MTMDSGMPPVGGVGGSSTEGGVPPMADAAVDAGPPDSGPPPVELPPYRGCTTAVDCDPGASCLETPGAPAYQVCAPACVNTTDCPVPEGMYEAVTNCAVGFCKLDCTPVVFAPLLTCPTGMTCIIADLGNAFCHDDGL
jgi:hypothetical protein